MGTIAGMADLMVQPSTKRTCFHKKELVDLVLHHRVRTVQRQKYVFDRKEGLLESFVDTVEERQVTES